MAKKTILVTKPITDQALRSLQQIFIVKTIHEYGSINKIPLADLESIRGIAGGKVSAELISKLPNLEIIANSGVGIDSNDIDSIRARNIAITNTPNVLNTSVAELTLALMFALARQIPKADTFVRNGDWNSGAFPLGVELDSASVGLVGMGNIGTEIATKLTAVNMHVSYYCRTKRRQVPYTYYTDLEAMARAVDWLVVIVPANATTEGLISRKVLAALGPKGRLVNVARGSIVDESALIELLQTGLLGAAALDVFATEPAINQLIAELDNVILSPHMGSRTHQARNAMDAMVVENLVAHFSGEQPPNIVPVL